MLMSFLLSMQHRLLFLKRRKLNVLPRKIEDRIIILLRQQNRLRSEEPADQLILPGIAALSRSISLPHCLAMKPLLAAECCDGAKEWTTSIGNGFHVRNQRRKKGTWCTSLRCSADAFSFLYFLTFPFHFVVRILHGPKSISTIVSIWLVIFWQRKNKSRWDWMGSRFWLMLGIISFIFWVTCVAHWWKI